MLIKIIGILLQFAFAVSDKPSTGKHNETIDANEDSPEMKFLIESTKSENRACVGELPSAAVCVRRDADCLGHTSYYLGSKRTTKNGTVCKNWDSAKQQQNKLSPTEGLEQENYCRNPNGYGMGPWCYTDDAGTKWDLCFDWCPCNSTMESSATCVDQANTCYKHVDFYLGNKNVTKSGRSCQHWHHQSPHTHRMELKDGRDVENYCRNPDSAKIGPWCYTTDPEIRYETCFEWCPSKQSNNENTKKKKCKRIKKKESK